MTTVLKSNVAATANLGDLSGLKDSGYYLSADFTRQKYKLAGAEVAFSDLFTYTRANVANAYVNGEIKEVAANTPIFDDWISDQKGLWSAPALSNLLGTGLKNTNQTLTHTLAARIGAAFILQMWGAGSVTVSGDVEIVDTYSLTATQQKYILYKTKANASNPAQSIVNFTVAGDVKHYQTYTNTVSVPSHPLLSATSAPSLFLKSSLLAGLTDFALIFRIRAMQSKNFSEQLIRLFEINTNLNAVSAIINTTARFSTRLSDGTTQQWATEFAATNTADAVLTVKYSANTIKLFNDGILLATFTGNASSVLSAIQFLYTTNFNTIGSVFCGLLKNVAIYTKTMSDDELKKLSQSFKW
ncbi:hypothetical protein IEC338SC_3225 [Acinetobacter pittii]|uniref:Uncharacterized protein n=1 Tax=Acinetobacter pittii TaxID=48296 RepID=A0AB33BDQ8_ACIPI|nr:hypothetical protein [Acinetobacter pittii]AMX20336.1 hypothetical protein IEC338SC_3225 [Acinetobacter pittii]